MASSSEELNSIWYWINNLLAFSLNALLTLLLVIYHLHRLFILRRELPKPPWKHWLFQFHFLLFVGYLASLPLLIFAIGCASNRSSWSGRFCSDDSGSAAPNALVLALSTLSNLGSFCLNACYAVIGFYARKEIVLARDGPRRWNATYRAPAALAILLALSGFLFFLSVAAGGKLTWSAIQIVSWIGKCVPVATTLASTITVGILTSTLKYSQRVLPFMPTKLLLVALLLALVNAVVMA